MTTTQFEQLINEIPTKEDFVSGDDNSIFLKDYWIAPDFNAIPHLGFGWSGMESSYMTQQEVGTCEFTLQFTLESKLFNYEDEEILLTDYQKELLQKTLDNKCSTTETIEE